MLMYGARCTPALSAVRNSSRLMFSSVGYPSASHNASTLLSLGTCELAHGTILLRSELQVEVDVLLEQPLLEFHV